MRTSFLLAGGLVVAVVLSGCIEYPERDASRGAGTVFRSDRDHENAERRGEERRGVRRDDERRDEGREERRREEERREERRY